MLNFIRTIRLDKFRVVLEFFKFQKVQSGFVLLSFSYIYDKLDPYAKVDSP